MHENYREVGYACQLLSLTGLSELVANFETLATVRVCSNRPGSVEKNNVEAWGSWEKWDWEW